MLLLKEFYCFVFIHLDANELEIARKGGLIPVVDALSASDYELLCQAARALRNLSVNSKWHNNSIYYI